MEHISLPLLFAILVILILISAFFSGSETGMMSLNRYRLRHLVRKNHPAAMRVSKLLERVDRLLGAILIGNTFANIFAASIATVIAVKLWGDAGVFIVTIALTLIVLVFAEIAPKTLASLHAQKFAFMVSYPLKLVLVVLYPLVFLANSLVKGVLWAFRVKINHKHMDALSTEELRTVVNEASNKITPGYQEMLIRILDLGKVSVEDIMVPRSEVAGLDLSVPWEAVLKQLTDTPYTRLPVYFENLDYAKGFLHTRKALNLISEGKLDKENLLSVIDKAYFIPESATLNVQLAHFRSEKYRIGLVVDEYGDIQGLATLEDILEEIVGEFTTTLDELDDQIQKNKDGSFYVEGGVSIRELNRLMNWDLQTDGSKTLSGLIVETLQTLPKKGVGLDLGGYRIEVMVVKNKRVKQAKIWKV